MLTFLERKYKTKLLSCIIPPLHHQWVDFFLLICCCPDYKTVPSPPFLSNTRSKTDRLSKRKNLPFLSLVQSLDTHCLTQQYLSRRDYNISSCSLPQNRCGGFCYFPRMPVNIPHSLMCHASFSNMSAGKPFTWQCTGSSASGRATHWGYDASGSQSRTLVSLHRRLGRSSRSSSLLVE